MSLVVEKDMKISQFNQFSNAWLKLDNWRRVSTKSWNSYHMVYLSYGKIDYHILKKLVSLFKNYLINHVFSEMCTPNMVACHVKYNLCQYSAFEDSFKKGGVY